MDPATISARRAPSAELRWLEVPASRVAQHEGVVDRLLDAELDGITITGVFSRAEIRRALPILEQHRRQGTPEPFGTMLGVPLNQIGPTSTDRTPHLEETERCRPIYRDAFGFDPHDRLAEVIGPMASGRSIEPPTEHGRAYNPGNVRWYDPGRGGLRAHVGNEFRDDASQGALTHLLDTTEVADHLSYFVVLQRPKRGGALAVFDLLYEEHPVHETPWDGALRDDRWFDTRPALRHDLRAGEMVVFCGGRRWHRVDPVEGSRPRITYGGFAGPARDGHVLRLWC